MAALIWYQRKDGLWNAECTCGATICGTADNERLAAEDWHFANAEIGRQDGHKYKPCGPKLPEEDLNNYFPHPWIFP